MPARPYKTWVETSASALRSNADALRRSLDAGTRLMAVVKANAYGHGIRETIRALGKDADWFGVDSVREADEVRAAGGRQPVLVMGYTPRAEIAGAVRRGFSLTVYDRESAAAAARAGTARRPARLHVKVETGTSRQGVAGEDLRAFARFLKGLRRARIEGISTHYANIEDTTDSTYAMAQLARFEGAKKILAGQGIVPEISHTAASAAAILYPRTHFGMVRAGIALYGLWPSKETRVTAAAQKAGRGGRLELRPALSWKTVVAQVKTVAKDTPVSYGLTERVTRRSKIAVIPVGYWDGFDRGLSSVGRVLIRGRRAKVLGRVCMNMFVVDVTDIPGVRAEDEAVLIGSQGRERLSAEDMAAGAGTINYETVARINPLIPRVAIR